MPDLIDRDALLADIAELSPIVKQLPTFKYCPNCGADMRGDDE